MNKKILASVLAVLLALGAAWYFWQQTRAVPVTPALAPQVAAPIPETKPPAPAVEPQPAIRYPLNAMLSSSSLPELGRSDAPFSKALGGWLGHRVLLLFFSDEMIRRIVKTVDNLPRKKLPPDAMPLKPVPGAFVTTGKGDKLAVSWRNAARYAVYLRVMRAIDAGKLVGIYVDFYPLFQRAYEETANSKAYFNDRLVEAMDDMLATPEPAEPVKLVWVDGLFVFADPELEARSAGQKILIRTGPANAKAIKAKLGEIRDKVTRDAAASQGTATGGSPGNLAGGAAK